MAAAAHFTASLYGIVEGSPPFQDGSGASAFSRQTAFPSPSKASLPTEGTNFWPLANGVLFGSTYVYSVIEVQPTGLNTHGVKYVCNDSVATLATAAG